MEISSFPTASVIIKTDLAKAPLASATQNAEVLRPMSTQEEDVARSSRAMSFLSTTLSESSSVIKSGEIAGVSIGLLNSMVATGLKMQGIRNDASISPEVKKRLLKPLEEANKNAMDIAITKEEREEKSKILDASNENADAIRKAGEEIAASAETNSLQSVALTDRNAPISEQEAGVGSQSNVAVYTNQAQTAVSVSTFRSTSAIYSASMTTPVSGESVDTHA